MASSSKPVVGGLTICAIGQGGGKITCKILKWYLKSDETVVLFS